MKTKQFSLLTIAVCVAHFVGSLLFIAIGLDDKVPLHFNFSGQADNWGSKWFCVFYVITPLILAVCYFIYEKKANFKGKKNNARYEALLVNFMVYLFIGLGWCFMLIAWKNMQKINAGLAAAFASLILSLILTGFSNYMGKIEQNPYMGIRYKWTLQDKTVWNRTHRITGYVGSIGGVVLFTWSVCQFLWEMVPPFASFAGVFCGVIGCIAVFPAFYAHRLYHKLHS